MAATHTPIADGLKKARIEIIPLIDVIFFLLATFVLFTLSLDKIVSLDVNLPKGKADPAPPSPSHLSIQVSDDGTYYLRTGTGAPELIAANEIAPRFADFHAKHGDAARVLVRGDRRAKFGPAAVVFDEARLAGIKQVSIETLTSRTGQ
jgi:biopolymer transport protein ExbD